MVSQDLPTLTYFKRFRMEIDVQDPLPHVPCLPPGYAWAPWEAGLIDQHADVKYQCFFEEIDAVVFPNLSSREGCLRLMRDISTNAGFKPEATWLIAYDGQHCGTIQGVRDRYGMGAIQNVGIIPEHRGRGLGRALVLQALHGFRGCGVHRVHLEVTTQNEPAIRLYRSLGFRFRKTIYKTADAFAALQGASSGWFA
ncbi:MAG: GNAT family N-acetyltransferase [Planctomycetes bacterium]|nr:GNAT family N-acetyltransferase [Planctomycetota bacterium]